MQTPTLILLIVSIPFYILLSIGAIMMGIATIISVADAPETRQMENWRTNLGFILIVLPYLFPVLALIGVIGGWISYFNESYETAIYWLLFPWIDALIFAPLIWRFFHD